MPFQLSDQTADTLLDKLASDDSFRELFQRAPREALASIGHAAAADTSIQEGAWSCMQVQQLASKQDIAASRDALRKQLTAAKASYRPIQLSI